MAPASLGHCDFPVVFPERPVNRFPPPCSLFLQSGSGWASTVLWASKAWYSFELLCPSCSLGALVTPCQKAEFVFVSLGDLG